MDDLDKLFATNLTLQEIKDYLEAKLREPKYRNKLTTDERVANIGMLYLVVKAILKEQS